MWEKLKLCLLFLTAGGTVLFASGKLEGVILDGESGQLLQGVSVSIERLGLEIFSDINGRFKFEGLDYGTYELKFLVPSYRPLDMKVSLYDTSLNIVVKMYQTGYTTPVIVVTDDHPKTEFDNLLELSYTLKDKQLQMSLGQTLAMSLKNESGISVRSMGPAPSRPVFRGLSGDRIMLSEDGIRTSDLSSTSPDHSVTIEPFSADRIEILRGPWMLSKTPVTIGGVINVVRSEIPEKIPSGFSFKSGFFGEMVNKGYLFSSVAEYPFYSLVIRGEATYRKTSDLYTPERVLRNSWSQTFNLSGGLSYIGYWGYTGFSVRDYNTQYGIPGGFVGAHPEGVRIKMLRRQHNFKFHYNFRKSLLDHVDFEVSRVFYRHTEFEKGDIIGSEFRIINWLGHANLFHKIFKKNDGMFGISGEYRDFNIGGYVFSPPASSGNLAFYANQNVSFKKWQFSAGIRYDYNNVNPHKVVQFVNLDSVFQRTFNTFSFSASVVRKITGNLNSGFILNYYSRVPTIEELFSDGPHLAAYSYEVGNPYLEHERGYGSEFFLFYKSKKVYSMFTFFYNYLPYYIIHRNTGRINFSTLLPVYMTQGIKARIYGAEAHSEFQLIGNFSVELAFNSSIGEIINYGPLPQTPPAKLHLSVKQSGKNYIIGISSEAALSQKRLDDFESPTSGYIIFSAFSQYSFITGNFIHSFSLNLDNITNRSYRNHLSRIKSILPEPGINLRFIYKLYY